jgi:hypothetical protein
MKGRYAEAHGVYSGDDKLHAKILKLRAAAAAEAAAAAAASKHNATAAPPPAAEDDDDAPMVAPPPPQLPLLSSSSFTPTPHPPTSSTTTTSSSPPPPPVAVPPHLWSCLFPYQRAGIAWMHNLYARNHGGILGDDMGLGKHSPLKPNSSDSSQNRHALARQDAASCVVHHRVVLQQARAASHPTNRTNNVTICRRLISRVIVCAPLSVMPHWQQEFAKSHPPPSPPPPPPRPDVNNCNINVLRWAPNVNVRLFHGDSKAVRNTALAK